MQSQTQTTQMGPLSSLQSPSNPICSSPCLSIYLINTYYSPALCLVPHRSLGSLLKALLTSKTLESPSTSPSLSGLKSSQQPKQAKPTTPKTHILLSLCNLTVSASVGALVSPLLDHCKSKLIFTTLPSIFIQSHYNPISLPRWIQPCDL